MVLPGDAKNLSDVVQVESIELVVVQSPCLTAIEQCTEHTGLIHLQLDVSGQHRVFPDLLCSEILHHLNDVVTNGDAWDGTEVLVHYFGLFKTDSETKLST